MRLAGEETEKDLSEGEKGSIRGGEFIDEGEIRELLFYASRHLRKGFQVENPKGE